MELSMKTVQALIQRWSDVGVVTDYAGAYGEPGYDTSGTTPLVVLGDFWCNCGKVLHGDDSGWPEHMRGKPAIHDHAHHRPRLWDQLNAQGVEFEWHDEWAIDSENDKAYRTSGDSYSWQPSFVYTDGGDMLTGDNDLDVWVEWATESPGRALPSRVWRAVDVIEAGFVKHNGQFESGWHPGQDDEPGAIADAIRDEHGEDIDVVFLLDGVGQFDVQFSAYYRVKEES